MNVQPIQKHSKHSVSFGVRILSPAQALLDRHFAQIARTGTVEDIMLARKYERNIRTAGNKKGLMLDANSVLAASIENGISKLKIHNESYILKIPHEKDSIILDVNNTNRRLTPIQKLKILSDTICKIAKL